MRYEDRIVCFSDILGFADHVRGTIREDGSDDEDRIKNIAEAVEIGVYGIDVCSGVESAPGRKDHAKMQKLFDNISHLRG